MLDQIQVPSGWSKELLRGDAPDIVLLGAPENMGYVTLNLKKRRWALGFSDSITLRGQGEDSKGIMYSGRGWLDLMVKDAVKALETAAICTVEGTSSGSNSSGCTGQWAVNCYSPDGCAHRWVDSPTGFNVVSSHCGLISFKAELHPEAEALRYCKICQNLW